jgi:hypothetical protein
MRVLERTSRQEERERRQSERILADAFGTQRGWIRSSAKFSLEQLSRRTSRILGDGMIFTGDVVFYREKQRPCRPAAIALHFAPWPDVGPVVENIAECFGLRYEAVADFPGWIDGAQLIVYTPRATQQEKNRKKAPPTCRTRVSPNQLRLFE